MSGKHPVYLERVDGHIGVANTRALQLASVTVASRDPDGGKIDRDDAGTPNGILREKAQAAVQSGDSEADAREAAASYRTGACGSGESRHHLRAGLLASGKIFRFTRSSSTRES